MGIFEKLVNEQIEEAIARGDFDNLPGAGKPINLNDDDHIPPDMRLAYRILKNAGVTSPEISLRKELENLKEELKETTNQEERTILQREIRMACLRISLLSELRR